MVYSRKLPDGKIPRNVKELGRGQGFLPDQVLETRVVAGRIRFARKQKHRDAGDLQQRAEAAPISTCK